MAERFNASNLLLFLLLADAGWRDTDGDGVLDKDGKRFEFTFMTLPASNLTQSKIAAIMREDFAKGGIVVDIKAVEWSVFSERVREWNYDACTGGIRSDWGFDPYPLWHSSRADVKGSANAAGFKSAEADRILEEARREFDLQKRIPLYHEFCRVMHEEQPCTFLLSPDDPWCIAGRFRNVKLYPLGFHFNTFWVPKEEQKYKE